MFKLVSNISSLFVGGTLLSGGIVTTSLNTFLKEGNKNISKNKEKEVKNQLNNPIISKEIQKIKKEQEKRKYWKTNMRIHLN